MKNTTAILSVLFTATAAFIVTSVLTSCNSKTVVRAKILENNTVTYCTLNEDQAETFHYLDTVWLNLSTHTIDDTSENTMQCVITK